MYLRLPLHTATAGYNRSAALWISMFAFTLMPSETACSVWNQERAVVAPHPQMLSAPNRIPSSHVAHGDRPMLPMHACLGGRDCWVQIDRPAEAGQAFLSKYHAHDAG